MIIMKTKKYIKIMQRRIIDEYSETDSEEPELEEGLYIAS